MALVRTFDTDFVNSIANHPEVAKGTLAKGYLDVSSFVKDPLNFCLFDNFGGFVLRYQGPGTYEIHTLFLPEGRGNHALEAAREVLQYMFTKTDCVLVNTFCTYDNRAAIQLALKFKFKPIEDAILLGYAGTKYSLDIKRWVMEVLCP